jgi:hypothetical protein
MALLHRYGGLWLDLETIALRNFSHLFGECIDDGHSVPSNQGVIGPLRPNTTFTRAWQDFVHAKLDSLKHNLKLHPGGACAGNRCEYALGWQGILGNIWRKIEAELAGVATGAVCLNACVYGCPIACYNKPEQKCAGADVAQGQNAGVSNGVKRMSYEQFLSSPGVLGQMIRRALAIPTSTVIARAIEEQRHCLTLAEERLYVNRSDAGGHTCPPPAHPQFESSAQWTVV